MEIKEKDEQSKESKSHIKVKVSKRKRCYQWHIKCCCLVIPVFSFLLVLSFPQTISLIAMAGIDLWYEIAKSKAQQGKGREIDTFILKYHILFIIWYFVTSGLYKIGDYYYQKPMEIHILGYK